MVSPGSPWFSAAGRALLLATRLNRYIADVQDAAAMSLPVPVIFAGPAVIARSATALVGHGAMT